MDDDVTDGDGRESKGRWLDDFLRVLIDRTADGTLQWEIDDGHQDSYCCSGSSWIVAVRSRDADRTDPYVIELSGDDGVVVFSVDSGDATGVHGTSKLRTLYREAVAAALTRHPLVDVILSDIGPGDERDKQTSRSD